MHGLSTCLQDPLVVMSQHLHELSHVPVTVQRAFCEFSIWKKNSLHLYEQVINSFYVNTYLMFIEFLLKLCDGSTIIIPICIFIQMRKLKQKMMNNQADSSFYNWLESDWKGSDSGALTPEPAFRNYSRTPCYLGNMSN